MKRSEVQSRGGRMDERGVEWSRQPPHRGRQIQLLRLRALKRCASFLRQLGNVKRTLRSSSGGQDGWMARPSTQRCGRTGLWLFGLFESPDPHDKGMILSGQARTDEPKERRAQGSEQSPRPPLWPAKNERIRRHGLPSPGWVPPQNCAHGEPDHVCRRSLDQCRNRERN
jgi:hypothetical protein